jgi:AcrR family transcriptional regulator
MARVAKENIREKILEAAERRLWHYGIKKTTIDEIAADAGVGKGTVYFPCDICRL